MPEIIGVDLASGPDLTAIAIQRRGEVVYSSTASEVRMRMAEFERRVAPVRAHLGAVFREQFALLTKMALRRRRKSKGWRRHVRMMKATGKR